MPEDETFVCRLLVNRRDGTITSPSNETGEIIISRGHVVLWSGEYLRTGVLYDVLNRHLFIAITLHKLEYVEYIVKI